MKHTIVVKKDENFTFFNKILKKYTGKSSEVSIPEGTVRIDSEAFAGCEVLRKVNIPSSVKTIGEKAFANCVNLEEINFPPTLSFIEKGAFSDCDKLKSVSLGGALTSVSKKCFYRCKSLKFVYLSHSIVKIDDRAFFNCTSLEKIRMSDRISEIGESAFENCFSLKKINVKEDADEALVFPDSLLKIYDRAFYSCSSVEKIVFGNKLEAIGEKAFYQCSVKKLSTPKSLVNIGAQAFSSCLKLEELFLDGNNLTIHYEAFLNCKGLSKIVFYEGVSEFQIRSFDRCRNIKEIIPNSNLQKAPPLLWSRTFDDDVVEEIRLSKPFINSKLFNHVYTEPLKWFKKLIEKKSHDKLVLFFKHGKKIPLEALEKMEEIASEFKDTEVLGMVISYKNSNFPPDVIEKIENEEFEKTLGLRERNVSDWRKIFTLTIKSDHVIISGYKKSDSERNVIIPESIGGKPVRVISEYAFRKTKIESIFIPETVSVILKRAFEDCKYLKYANIPSSVTVWNEGLFSGCIALENLEISSVPKKIEENVFFQCPVKALRIFDGSLYLEIAGNEKYALISADKKKKSFFVPEETKIIAGSSFYLSEAEEIHIPNGVTYIGNTAFFRSKIKKINFPESVVEIGDYVFSMCNALEVIRIPATVKKNRC